MSSHQSVSRLIRESLAVVTNVFNESRTRDGGGDLRSLGVWLEKTCKYHNYEDLVKECNSIILYVSGTSIMAAKFKDT